MSIEVRRITKRFGSFVALEDVSFKVGTGELVALLGPSGSGKTTLLRIIAGLEAADSGTVLFEGEDATTRSARHRQVGFVFQHYALFRHMSVFENVAFGLRVRPRRVRPSRGAVRDKVGRLLGLVQLERYADRLPSQLSGGQRQRVALARALAVEPKVLLLDEPCSALDPISTFKIEELLIELKSQYTVVIVTHNMYQASRVSDRTGVFLEGDLIEFGDTQQVFERPRDERTDGYVRGRFG